MDRIAQIQNALCTEEFCHVCGRPTDHWGEHTPEQLLAAAARQPFGREV